MPPSLCFSQGKSYVVLGCGRVSRYKGHSMTIRSAASAVLVAIAFLNLGHTNRSLSILPARYQDEVVSLEERLKPVRYALMQARYENGGPVGYLTAGIIRGGRASAVEEKYWAQSRYVMIPWNLVLGTMEPSYVIVDLWGTEVPFEIPAEFAKVYGTPDGLMLLMRMVQ